MRKVFVGACLLGVLTMTISGQENAITLDKAINESGAYLAGRLDPGTIVAVMNFSAAPAVSNYVIEALTDFFVNDGNLVVVDRRELDLLQGEMDFQLSGEVSDESAQAIGKKLGAQAIISGSLSPLGNRWRMRVKTFEVETAKIQGAQAYTVKRDAVLSSLLPRTPKTTGQKTGTGAANIALGLGSFLEGDIAGGLTLTAGYAVAAGLFTVEAAAMDWDSPAAGVPATIGIAVAGGTLVYGFIRPFIYNRNRQAAALLDNMYFNIAPASDNGFQRPGMRFTYRFNF
jgi:hypothetical protein